MRKINFLPAIAILFVLFCLTNCTKPKGNIQLPSLFSDHLVLQQNSKAAIWGTATPAIPIEIKGSWGNSEKTITDASGNWQVKLPTPEAGGPFELQIIAADTSITIKDVMTGEVWICSGQSNMEMPLVGWPPNDLIDNSAAEIRLSNYPMVRMFTVAKTIEVAPVKEVSGSWEVCSPKTSGNFSATAYYFGTKLYGELKIPIGLIHTSWGGTLAEAWAEGKHLASLEDFKDVLTQIERAKPQQAAFNNWLNEKEVLDNTNLPEKTRWENMDFKDATLIANGMAEDWPTMNLPAIWEDDALKGFDGTVLFKKEFELPATLSDQELVLELGAIDDMDETYLNGKLVGSTMGNGFWNKKRVYPIDKGIAIAGTNTLTIRVVDTGGGGGVVGATEDLNIHAKNDNKQTVNLAGTWNYLPIADYNGGKFYLFGGTMAAFNARPKVELTLDANTPTVLYNGMIAPLIPYTIKGAIWYQGESNANRAKQYETLFPKMIESWRDEWNQGDFPFYFAQIAPFNYGDSTAIQSAQLRDAQRKTLKVLNTGMAVTLDIGNVHNIHPGNKQDVGNRLALWALAKDYGRMDAAFSGPLFKEMTVEGNKANLSFYYAESGLFAKEKLLKGFEIAGENGEFLAANAVIEGEVVVVSHPTIQLPKQVRYAFRNGSSATLFNEAGLPASSFSTEE